MFWEENSQGRFTHQKSKALALCANEKGSLIDRMYICDVFIHESHSFDLFLDSSLGLLGRYIASCFE